MQVNKLTEIWCLWLFYFSSFLNQMDLQSTEWLLRSFVKAEPSRQVQAYKDKLFACCFSMHLMKLKGKATD